ncbi:MAG: hypothetical protein B7Z81_14405, partial [Acidocella sp. 20-61-6]
MAEPPRPSRVHILLSTYNGARFLQAQLDSLLAQSYPHWRLHWRDDGSADDTVGILRAFAAGAGAGRCIESASSGPHLGACPSFLTLLAETMGAQAGPSRRESSSTASISEGWLGATIIGPCPRRASSADSSKRQAPMRRSS